MIHTFSLTFQITCGQYNDRSWVGNCTIILCRNINTSRLVGGRCLKISFEIIGHKSGGTIDLSDILGSILAAFHPDDISLFGRIQAICLRQIIQLHLDDIVLITILLNVDITSCSRYDA